MKKKRKEVTKMKFNKLYFKTRVEDKKIFIKPTKFFIFLISIKILFNFLVGKYEK